MSDLIVRPAASADFEILAAMIDGFAKGHPAENHPRSADKIRDAFFGSHPIAHALLAEKNGAVVGFGAWRKSWRFPLSPPCARKSGLAEAAFSKRPMAPIANCCT